MRVPNLALALEAELALDLDSERCALPALRTGEVTLPPGFTFDPGHVMELGSEDGTRWRLEAVNEDRATVAEVRDAEMSHAHGDDARRHVYSCHYCLCRDRWIPRWEPGTCPGCGVDLTYDGVAVRDGGVTDEG